MNGFAWGRSKTISDAAAGASMTVAEAMTNAPDVIAHGQRSIVMAGGVDLLDLLKEDLLAPGLVLSLRDIPALGGISEEASGGCRVGPMSTLAEIADHPLLRARYPALADAARVSASPQIRRMATLGGNLLQRPRCWYFRAAAFRCSRKGGSHCFAMFGENQYHAVFDNIPCAIVHPSTSATALVALGATIELTSAMGAVRTVLLEDFFVLPMKDVRRENELQPHEIVTAIHLPPVSTGMRMAHLKQGEKDSFDWPLADVAVVLNIDQNGACARASIVLGAAAPAPHRAKAAEAILAGQRVDDGKINAAATAALKGATPLAKNAYKLPLFEALVRRALRQALT